MNRELLQQALDALMCCTPDNAAGSATKRRAITALRSALAAPQPEPVGQVLSEAQMGIGYDRRMGDVIWFNKPPGPAMLYAAPPAAPAPAVRPDEFSCPYCFDQGVAPAVREPLTDAQIDEIDSKLVAGFVWIEVRTALARAIEQAHGIGGGGK